MGYRCCILEWQASMEVRIEITLRDRGLVLGTREIKRACVGRWP